MMMMHRQYHHQQIEPLNYQLTQLIHPFKSLFSIR